MTVSSTTRKAGPFFGNAVTTAFPFTFKVFTTADITLTRTDAAGVVTTLTLGSDYSIVLNVDQDNNPGGTITYPLVGSPLGVGLSLTAVGSLVASQGADITNVGRFLPQLLEDALDKLTILSQQVLEKVNRALVVPASDTAAPSALATATARAGKFFGFDAGGQPALLSGTGNDTALRTDLVASGGSALMGFTQGVSGAAPVIVQSKLREIVSVAWFFANAVSGALVDLSGVTDSSAGVQAAINAAQAASIALYLNPGNIKIGTALSVTGNLTMYGAGANSTYLVANTTTQDVISINTGSGRITFSDFTISGKTTATAGALIRMTGNTINLYSSFTNVKFQDGWDQLTTIAAASWSCMFCSFFSPKNTGVFIQDTVNTDGGDMGIFNSLFIGGGVGIAVSQVSAGGLRFIGNKVINWANGYQCSLAAGVNTSDLFIQGCSFEAFTDTAITCALGGGVGFGAVHILGNEINNALVGIKLQTDSGPWLNIVAVVGNEIANTTNTAMFIQGTRNFVVADNNFVGSGVGISLGAIGSHGRIHDNLFSGFATPIAGVSAGMTSLVIHDNDGYNPVGASTLAPTASPWTFTNGPSPSDVYLNATTNVVGVNINSQPILPVATPNFSARLGPNEVLVVAYTGTLTATKMTH